ncbi:DHH family phosphoesterase [Candidatus Mycoplasma haematominutum]|uniref:DHH family phosphoesterase (MgpA-like protein) n=1 Tax=Candidatus Mycoplasma haematominutum 'Birmingham 1' TaxID=1116213 RepID=G8C2V6_9MOLU|nr:bifunctional oligoribonuclease/PAP phosphatase NrnA [Candidatus Mycoplasma haematominutum]CCE66654.1 DHH family phosphoesterase (MgpA-like protein) [Candidatus Mycoplasma haematominutum 'Birmingham 1']
MSEPKLPQTRRVIETFGLKFLQKIKEYRYICLFLHVKPDCDSYASVFALHKWLKNNFPKKKVIIWIEPAQLTKNEKLLFHWTEKIKTKLPDEKLKESLGIIVDTPIQERVLSQKHTLCRETIIIDHHPKMDLFSQLEFVNHSYSSTSEILAELFLFLEEQNEKYIFETHLSRYLYVGIITDSNHLKDNVTPSTFYILWRILSKGINRKSINDLIVENSLDQKLFDQEVVKNIRITPNGLAFSIVTNRLLQKYSIQDYLPAISNLENIAGIEIWVIIIYDKSIKRWKCSIRSKELPIDNIAQQFKGGGHKKSAAVLFKHKWEYWELLNLLDDYLIKFGYANSSGGEKFGRTYALPTYRKLSQKLNFRKS